MANKQTCVVAGGAGFIGSHLCDSLLSLGYKVFAIDNLITGTEANLNEAKKNPDFTFIKWDVSEKLPVIGAIDYIFHLASPASVPDYQKYPKETALANSVGTIHLLDVCKAYGSKFLFASTSEVYGNPKEHPQKETYWGNVNPHGIRACYDESKRYGEMMTMLYATKYNVDARIIRIFNTYGPRMRKTDGRVVSNFINQAIANEPLTVYGDGKQTRSFCFVSDLVSGIVKAMFEKETLKEVINLGNPDERTILEFAQTIQKMTGTTSKITYTKLPDDDPTIRCPDITKAKTKLSWEPAVSLNDGLLQTITYYKALL